MIRATPNDPRHTDHGKAYVQDYFRRYGARKVEANALVVAPELGRDLCRAPSLNTFLPRRPTPIAIGLRSQ
jgi:hypothetical protein